jgi:hypothetical protein
MTRKLALGYFAGAVAGGARALATWIAARAGFLAALDVHVSPAFTWSYFEPRLLWGGIFGLGYAGVRRLGAPPLRAALLLALVPALVELLVFLPRSGAGMLGVRLGALAPLIVLAENALWGLVLAQVVRSAGPSA